MFEDKDIPTFDNLGILYEGTFYNTSEKNIVITDLPFWSNYSSIYNLKKKLPVSNISYKDFAFPYSYNKSPIRFKGNYTDDIYFTDDSYPIFYLPLTHNVISSPELLLTNSKTIDLNFDGYPEIVGFNSLSGKFEVYTYLNRYKYSKIFEYTLLMLIYAYKLNYLTYFNKKVLSL